MITTNQFKNGTRIEIDGEPFVIVDFQHVKPGKGGAFVRTKIKSLVSGNVLEKTYRSGDKVKRADFEDKKMQHLYRDDDGFHFMDLSTYDQVMIGNDDIGDASNYLKEQQEVQVQIYQGKAIGVDLPAAVELVVAKTEPGVRGDTATGATKQAEMETGAVINVPLFIEEGETLKIDTRTGEYIERVR